MIRLIVKSSFQVSQDEWSVFYETVDIEHADLESKMKNGGRHVVGSEIVKTPTSDNSDYESAPKLPSLDEVKKLVDVNSYFTSPIGIEKTYEAIKKLGNFS